MIEFVFEQENGHLTISGRPHVINHHRVQFDCATGWQLLKFDSSHSVKITDCLISGRSIGHLLFIMFRDDWSCSFGHIDPGQSSYLPVHDQYSEFRSEVYDQLTNGWFGQQIYQHFDFVLDTGCAVNEHHPQHIKDYFSKPTGPHWLQKYNTQSPWFIHGPVDTAKLKQELALIQWPAESATGADTNAGWSMCHILGENINLQELGAVYLNSIAEAAGFTNVTTVSYNQLQPGGHIGIHRDGSIGKNRKKLYINLDANPGVIFKFNKGGCVPMANNNAVWVNTDGFVHAVVNDSQRSRQIVSIQGEVEWPAIIQ